MTDLLEELKAGLLLADVAHLDLDTVAKVAVQQVDQLICRLVDLLRVHIGETVNGEQNGLGFLFCCYKSVTTAL